jgi:hypothetical protein
MQSHCTFLPGTAAAPIATSTSIAARSPKYILHGFESERALYH